MTTLFDQTIPQFSKMLGNLDAWLGAAVALAEQKKFSPDVIANSRLAADMFTLIQQVQSACDAAKYAGAYMSGTTPPSHPDTETTMVELRARIATVRAHLETVTRESCAGAEERKVSPPWLHGAWLTGADYITQVAIPNFYFHVVTAYDILRHNGVALGKQAFIGAMPVHT
ncbi:MAG: DUF1993 domain-containing protein [Deltaproteobacteria bacterium]|nr:DUF1993 domain-containing protein [Deltaproteobacteria bacterium]